MLVIGAGAFITGSTFLIDGGATASYFYGPLQPWRFRTRKSRGHRFGHGAMGTGRIILQESNFLVRSLFVQPIRL